MEEEEKEFVGFELEVSAKRELETLAARTERSLAAILRLIVRQYLDAHTVAKD